MKKTLQLRLQALKPRNVLSVLARQRSGAGRHSESKRPQTNEHKDLVQRLREAGM